MISGHPTEGKKPGFPREPGLNLIENSFIRSVNIKMIEKEK